MIYDGKTYRNLQDQVGYLTGKYDDLQDQINDVRAHLTHYVVVDTLPTGDDIDPSAVYLLGPMGTAPDTYYEEWVYVQKADETWMWEKLGDTDSVDLSGYLQKQTGTTTYNQIYAKTSGGEQTMLNVYSDGTDASTVAMRDSYGRINCANPGTGAGDGINAVNKQYADANYVAKQTGATTYPQVYGKYTGGSQAMVNYHDTVVNNALVLRGATGQISVPENPAALSDATSKKYVTDTFIAKHTASTTYAQAYVKNADGSQGRIDLGDAVDSKLLVRRNGEGQINVPTVPTNNAHAASKKYVDDCVGQLLYLHDIEIMVTVDATNNLYIKVYLINGSSTAITSISSSIFKRMNVQYGCFGPDVETGTPCAVTKIPYSFIHDLLDSPNPSYLYQYISGGSLISGETDYSMTVTVTDSVISF